jgi:transposase
MPGTAFVNDRVCFRTEERQRVISVQGIVVAHYSIEDRAAEAYAMVMLFESGYADQNDIARCFGYSIRTLHRYHRHTESDGLAALARPKGRPSGSSCAFKQAHERDRIILRLKAKGMSNRWIGGRLGRDEKQVRRSLRRLGWRPSPEPQLPLLPKAILKTESATVSADKSSGTSS